jgi:hypothetical protein
MMLLHVVYSTVKKRHFCGGVDKRLGCVRGVTSCIGLLVTVEPC